MSLTHAIKQHARSLGFTMVGVTTCHPLPHVDTFMSWLEERRHGEMAYLDSRRSRQCRGRPDLVLPECRSVLVLGMRYPAPPPRGAVDTADEHLHGTLAAYACGDDYHDTLSGRLRSLVEFIEGQVGHTVPNRWYTDTGPILERELAQRAGLGWIGKNTCLINPRQGSYFLLAEILLGIELEPDQPFTADRCGACRRCIEACPTGCILPDRLLDARRCISYLTIELKGSIPPELRPLMGNWVFGCDVCQQVCPWNRFAALQGDPGLMCHPVDPEPNLLDALALQVSEFNRVFRHSPLRRAKRRGYLRNIAVALGNQRSIAAVTVLAQVLANEAESLVRAHAAWALGKIEDARARQALEQFANKESDLDVLKEIQSALGND